MMMTRFLYTEPIDDEEEFDMVADAFDEILDEMEFNSMSEDD